MTDRTTGTSLESVPRAEESRYSAPVGAGLSEHVRTRRSARPSPSVSAALQLLTAFLDEEVDDAEMTPAAARRVLVLESLGFRWTITRELASRLRTPGLSPREAQIAHMVAAGRTNREIASLLGISPCTVAAHMRRMFAKLEVSSRAALAAITVTTEE